MGSLLSDAERLSPDVETIETSSSEEYCDNVYDRQKNPEYWRLFSSGDKNYAVYRASVAGPPLDEAIEGPSEPKEAWTAEIVSVTELSLTKARRVGASILIPGVSISYIEADGVGGYGGYNAWVIEANERKPLEDIFWLPGSRNTGDGHIVIGDDGEQVAMPNLGGMCAETLLAATDRLSGVDLADYIGPTQAVIA